MRNAQTEHFKLCQEVKLSFCIHRILLDTALSDQMIRSNLKLLLLVVVVSACAVMPAETTPARTLSVPALNISPQPDTPEQTLSPGFTPTPTMCTGWNCTLEGTVCVRKGDSCTALEGIQVNLSQMSYCSPTGGNYETRTDRDGHFAFDVYLHDTDSFTFTVELDGYEQVRTSIGGFDCLYCSCPPLEIVLEPVER
jgi:hypothetical protein